MSGALRLALLAAVVACASLALPTAGPGARSSTRAVEFGVADDAWLAHGPGTLESRLDELSELGVDVVRFTVRWNRVAARRPANPRDPADRAYEWGDVDVVLRGLRRHGIEPVMKEALARVSDGTDRVHVSFDLDALDPEVAPGVGTPVKGGLDYREAHLLMEILSDSGLMTSLEVVEANPILDVRNASAAFAVELVQSAFGKRIL